MSGDVFGNGMLRETTIQLVAAFDHRDIFIDPDPDPIAASPSASGCSTCRDRAGRISTSTLISAGGGVFSRNAKEIELSAEAQTLLGIGEQVDARRN